MELQMETVLTLPQLRGEPIDADPGGRGRRAPPLASSEPARGSLSTRKIARSVLDDQASSPLPGMRKWMLVEASSGPASRGEVHPPAASIMVLGACGHCRAAPARAPANSELDRDPGTRVCLVTSTARPAFLGRGEAVFPPRSRPFVAAAL